MILNLIYNHIIQEGFSLVTYFKIEEYYFIFTVKSHVSSVFQ